MKQLVSSQRSSIRYINRNQSNCDKCTCASCSTFVFAGEQQQTTPLKLSTHLTLREGGTNNILVHDKRTIEPRCILIHLQRYFAYFVLLCAQQRNQLQKTTVKVMFNLTKNMFIYIFMITLNDQTLLKLIRQVSARVISQSCLFCHFHFEFPLIAGIVFKFGL